MEGTWSLTSTNPRKFDGGWVRQGDLVRVLFPYDETLVGVFMGYDPSSYREQPWDDFPVDPTRAKVFWDGQIYSTPLDQIEAINETQ